MTVNLRAGEISSLSVGCALNPIRPGRWSLLDDAGHRLAVAQVRCALGSVQDGWVEAWSVLDREGLRVARGARTLRYEGSKTVPVPRAEATIWAATTLTTPPTAAAVEAERLDLDEDEEPEGQLWQIQQVLDGGPPTGDLCGWLLREMVQNPDGSEVWVDHWHLLPHHRHPAPGVEWRLLPLGACDLPTFLRRLSAPGARAYVRARYALPPARLRLSAFS